MKTTIKFLFLLCAITVSAQKYSSEEKKMLNTYMFNPGFVKPATKKVSTLVTKDGKTYRGFCRGVDYKKGQIIAINFRDSVTDEKKSFSAAEIAEAWLYASGFESFGKSAELANNWGVGRISAKKLRSKDASYFVNQKVKLKNKKDAREVVMQLVNPEFDDYISFFHDSEAKESKGVKLGVGPTLGGGVIFSYYVKKGDRVFWLQKKDLKKEYEFLFGDSKKFMEKYPLKEVKWEWLSALVLEYTKMKMEEEGKPIG